jgi:hypothetical protein
LKNIRVFTKKQKTLLGVMASFLESWFCAVFLLF